MLSWNPPSASNGVLRGYEVHYVRLRLLHECEGLPPSDGTQVRVTPNQTYLQLSNLTGGADYEVSVRATTVTDGPWKSHWFTTSHEEPDGPPLHPVLRDVTSVTATVYWSPPDCRTTNGVVQGYQLRLSSDAPWVTEELINTTKDIGFSMTHLVPFTSYRLGVAAVNSAGKGPEATLDFETLPGVPPAPGNLTAYSTGRDFIAITWWAPYPPAGLPEFYKVFYKTTSETTFQGQFMETPTSSVCESDVRQGRQCAVVRKLVPNTVYQVFVVAKNEGVDDWSDRSNTVVAETKETVPDPPSQLVQDSREESSLTVSWKEPMISHGIITGYRVMLAGQYADPEQKESVEVGPEARNHSFLFLKPGSSFTVTVEAKTSAGYGKPIELIAYTRAPVPPVQTKVEVKTVDDTTITLSLAPTEDDDQDVSAYYVLVMRQEDKEATERTRRSVSGRDGVHEWTAGKVDYNTSQEMGLPYYMAAQMTSATIRNRSDFTVGDGKYYGGFYNAPLVTGSTYDIGLAAEVDFEGDSRISYKLLSEAVRVGRQDVTTNGTATTAALVSLLVIVAVLLVVTWRWRKQIVSRMSRSVVKKTVIPASDATNLTFDNDGESLDIEMEEIHTSDLSSSKPIPVAGLQEYVQRMLICEGFKQEYTGQGRGPQYPTSEGQRLENRIKNRYGNQLPYDHSRVKLKPTPGIAFSDYINANYIDGYCRPKRYIATQGPRTNTVSDFWKMVWQENVCKIVMLTNLIEKGKAKCEQYWPDEAATYGDIQVHLMASETFPDYDVRQLHLTLADTTREVKHFHLRSWPDHGVPLYPNVLLAFRKKVNQYRAFNEAPVVVHCSAGVGRTGTYILLDTLQEQAMSEGVVDVVGQLAAIRKSRMNLVETLEQYNLVYRALMESICVRDHSVPCVKLEERLKELLSPDEATGKSKLVAEFQELNTLKPWFTPADFIAVREQSSLCNNKDVETLPSDRSRPLLKDGTFVNAVYVNGFHKKRKFLVTQMPSTKDLAFWKLVHESGTRTIVTLDTFDSNEDDPTALAGCPRSGGIKLEDLKVECVKELDNEGIRTHTLTITSKLKTPAPASGPEPVKHFQLPTWSQPEAMVDLVDRVERWQQQSGDKIIFVLCRNGCSASGLFCCSALVLEKLKAEQEVDVFYATRIIRESRPQFIENPEQYRFCYDTALAYLDSVSMYANFQQS
ncbi:receptor-type tyrosine-protein phosphatase epsilon [Ixodes scapularis]|nr:receptor-type tyrosine-protein phosphatase epsilon [Ixodes scapularis]